MYCFWQILQSLPKIDHVLVFHRGNHDVIAYNKQILLLYYSKLRQKVEFKKYTEKQTKKDNTNKKGENNKKKTQCIHSHMVDLELMYCVAEFAVFL